jgi:hypothetical protein
MKHFNKDTTSDILQYLIHREFTPEEQSQYTRICEEVDQYEYDYEMDYLGMVQQRMIRECKTLGPFSIPKDVFDGLLEREADRNAGDEWKI